MSMRSKDRDWFLTTLGSLTGIGAGYVGYGTGEAAGPVARMVLTLSVVVVGFGLMRWATKRVLPRPEGGQAERRWKPVARWAACWLLPVTAGLLHLRRVSLQTGKGPRELAAEILGLTGGLAALLGETVAAGREIVGSIVAFWAAFADRPGGTEPEATVLGMWDGVFILILVILAIAAIFRQRGEKRPADEPQTVEQIIDEEKTAIREAREEEESAGDFVGLALSGGGIRSATFNLGLLTGLANHRLLGRIDYLSTVSGGGYIGSWLSQWIRRQRDKSPAEAVEEISAELAAPEDPAPVAHLREYSNYLTPKVGLLTADTWTTVATYLRNFLLNAMLIAALGVLVLMTPRLLMFVAELWGFIGPADLENRIARGVARHWSLFAALALAWLGVHFLVHDLRQVVLGQGLSPKVLRWTRDVVPEGIPQWIRKSRTATPLRSLYRSLPILEHATQGQIQLWIVLPLVAAAALGTYWLSLGETTAPWHRWAILNSLAFALPWLLGAWGGAWRLGREPGKATDTVPRERRETWVETNWVMGFNSLFVGAAVGIGFRLLNRFFVGLDPWERLVVGPPCLLAVFTFSAVLAIGLAGNHLSDLTREWLARAGAWVMIYALGWLALMAAATFGPVLLRWSGDLGSRLLASGWILTSVGGALAGRGRAGAGPLRGRLVKLAPWVFVVGLLLALSWSVDLMLLSADAGSDAARSWTEFADRGRPPGEERLEYRTEELDLSVARRTEGRTSTLGALADRHYRVLDHQVAASAGPRLWVTFLLVAAGALILGWRVKINEFSMHNYYRNRLVRAYLGASNPDRDAEVQPFTGMAESDDVSLGVPRGENGAYPPMRPYHLINTALNLVGGDRLAWQERKAAPFTLAPFHFGFAVPEEGDSSRFDSYYRPTNQMPALTLGTALATSGAAASPNMGFRSSPALSLLLTVFNVRLGWWLGNPAHADSWRHLSPPLAFLPLAGELFGITTRHSGFVYLSDGAHFENLGIYELVRRRCRFIIASDVGTDPELTFEDLGNAIRKCRTDLGAEIQLDLEALPPDDAGHSRRHLAVGTISYPATATEPASSGWLLYIKSSITGDESQDVLQYKRANKAFPHQTTADQFFDESQFESYRALGEHVADEIFGKATSRGFRSWKAFLTNLSGVRVRKVRASALKDRARSQRVSSIDISGIDSARDDCRDLEVDADEIGFPLGFAVGRPNADLETWDLHYYYVHPTLRRCGVAQHGLRHLRRVLEREDLALRLADSRPAGVSEENWAFFADFFDRATRGV